MSAAVSNPGAVRVTQVRVIVSELTKLRSLRSTVWTLLAAAGLILGFGILVTLVVSNHWPPENPKDAAGFEPVSTSLAGAFLAQLPLGVLGVMVVTGEYSTGMIRATLSAVPRRLPVLWAKVVVFAATSLVVTLPALLVAFLVGQRILGSQDIDTTLGAPGVLRVIIGTALYLTLVGLLGLGLGTALRSTPAAISTLFGLLFVLPIVMHFLPSSWSEPIAKYLPGNAGQSLTQLRQDPSTLAPWPGFAVFALYAVLAIGVGAWVLRRRDA